MSAADPTSFPEWKLRNGPTQSEDPDGKLRALMEAGWNGAVEAAAAWLITYAQRHSDMRAAALEAAAENITLAMQSPRRCSCCGQPVIDP